MYVGPASWERAQPQHPAYLLAFRAQDVSDDVLPLFGSYFKANIGNPA
jgi:hypothetical protein